MGGKSSDIHDLASHLLEIWSLHMIKKPSEEKKEGKKAFGLELERHLSGLEQREECLGLGFSKCLGLQLTVNMRGLGSRLRLDLNANCTVAKAQLPQRDSLLQKRQLYSVSLLKSARISLSLSEFNRVWPFRPLISVDSPLGCLKLDRIRFWANFSCNLDLGRGNSIEFTIGLWKFGGFEMGRSESGEEASTSEFHVLAVDDSALDRKIIEKLLKISSYQVTTVDSVRKALEFLGLEEDEDDLDIDDINVNLIITDYCMPGLTGYDLLKRVKESSSLKDIPVVIMSSENVQSRISRCLEEGAEDFILKPVQLSDVKRLKSHMLRDQQPTSNKRKVMSDSLSPQASERRPRLSGLTVA
eukprot:Gb_10430 [translate_table: standard]